MSSLFLVFELGATAFGPYGYYIDEPYYLACADATHELSPEERRRAVVLAATYDIAAAAELLGTGLPPVVSPHNSYSLWAGEELEHEPSAVVVAVGFPEALLARHFRSLRRAGERRCAICLGDSPDVAIFIGRGPLTPLGDWFGELRRMR